jgi:predicted esterase
MAAERVLAERFLEVPRTARYWIEGAAGEGEADAVRDVWFLLHGYGQLARDILEAAAPLAGPGRLVVAPEALSRFYPTGPGVGASWMTREDRQHEIRDYVRYLDAVADEVLAAAAFSPPPRVHLLGFSQGAATAARWAASGRIRPATLVLWGGAPPVDLNEGARRRLSGMRVRLIHGTRDRLVGPDALAGSAAGLREGGADVSIETFEGGHRLDATVLAALASA